MEKIAPRKLSWAALKALCGRAMRLLQELGLPWREIARVGLNTTIMCDWAQRYPAKDKAGLVSRKPGLAYRRASP